MTSLESEFRSLLAVESVDGLDPQAALSYLARLIDLVFVFKAAGPVATATVGEGGRVDLADPIVVKAGEAFIAVPEQIR
jgi:hypothetical protein